MVAGDARKATVIGARRLSPHVRELTLRPEVGDDTPLDFLPGQWLSLRLPVGEHQPLVRAYSLAAPPAPDGSLVLCFDRVESGLGTGYLWDLPVGVAVEFTGPVGNFTLPDGDSSLLLAARYTGIVPFLAMLRVLDAGLAPARPVRLVYGAPSREELVYHDELAALAVRSPWLDYRPVLPAPEPGWDGAVGTEQEVIAAHADAWKPIPLAMACGVREFTKPLREWLMTEFGLDRRSAKVENYTGSV
jgi:NAD(P)H-flavin reductase